MNIALILEWKRRTDMRDEDIASKTGLHFNTVQKLLAGKVQTPHRSTIRAFSALTGIPESELRQQREETYRAR